VSPSAITGRLIGATAVATITLVALTLACSPAVAAADDRSATAAYVRADYALVVSAHAKQGAAESILRSLLARVRRDCPSVVAGSPQNEASEKLTAALIGTMRVTAMAPIAKAATSYARAVSSLRWSNRALTRAVRTYARELLAQVRLAVPDFCGQLQAWKASGYTTLTPATLRFNRAYYSVDVAIGLLPRRQLAPFLTGADIALARRAASLESAVVDFEAKEVETWGEIMNSAGLEP
jgi:hypothetical protein